MLSRKQGIKLLSWIVYSSHEENCVCVFVSDEIDKWVMSGLLIITVVLLMVYNRYQTSRPVIDSKDTVIIEYVESLQSSTFSGTILVAKGDTILATNAIGLADREKNIQNTLDTQFNLGSMNKMFTATAIMQLYEEGKIELNKTVGDYIPDYPNIDIAEKATVHHLLTHTSGLGDFFYPIYYQNSWSNHSDVIDYLPLFVDDQLLFEPGAQFSYSNAGFIVLGLIIEEVTGQNYFDYISENIFTPCEMTDSTYLESERAGAKVAIGYSSAGVPNIDERLLNGCPAGGGYSTIHDLYNFSRALLAGELLG